MNPPEFEKKILCVNVSEFDSNLLSVFMTSDFVVTTVRTEQIGFHRVGHNDKTGER